MTHSIKILEPYATAIVEGRKTFEVRYNDRGYNCGDFVRFKVLVDGIEMPHPLRDMKFRITYVHSGLGLEKDYVVFGIERVEEGAEK